MSDYEPTQLMPRVPGDGQEAPAEPNAASEAPAPQAAPVPPEAAAAPAAAPVPPAPAAAPVPPAAAPAAADITTMMPAQGVAYTIEPQPLRPVVTRTVPDLTGFDVGLGLDEPASSVAPASATPVAPAAAPAAAVVAPAAEPVAEPAATAQPEQASVAHEPEKPEEPKEEKPRFRRIEPRPDEVAPKPAPAPAAPDAAAASAAAAPAAAAAGATAASTAAAPQSGASPAGSPAGAPRVSPWAIAALVVSAAALIASWMPLINNGAFAAGIIGAILAIVALVSVVRGKSLGRGLAIAALVVGVLAALLVPIFQQMSPPSATALFNRANAPVAVAAGSAGALASDVFALAPGQTVDLDNGMSVVLNNVRPGLSNYDGTPIVGVNVTYTNHSDQSLAFSVYDWKGENAAGEQSSETIYNEAQNRLSTGKLAPGGAVTGNIYFKGDTMRVHYYADVVSQQSSTAAWKLS